MRRWGRGGETGEEEEEGVMAATMKTEGSFPRVYAGSPHWPSRVAEGEGVEGGKKKTQREGGGTKKDVEAKKGGENSMTAAGSNEDSKVKTGEQDEEVKDTLLSLSDDAIPVYVPIPVPVLCSSVAEWSKLTKPCKEFSTSGCCSTPKCNKLHMPPGLLNTPCLFWNQMASLSKCSAPS